jgi:hypothetical protein
MDIAQSPSGKIIKASTGYKAFAPAALPPQFEWDNALVYSLPRADFFCCFDNNQIAYFVMALTILAACPSISPSSELREKLATCSYKLSCSLWSLSMTAAKLSTGSNGR